MRAERRSPYLPTPRDATRGPLARGEAGPKSGIDFLIETQRAHRLRIQAGILFAPGVLLELLMSPERLPVPGADPDRSSIAGTAGSAT